MDEGTNAEAEKKQRLSMMVLSVSVSALLMMLKFYSFWLTGSSAILSDALESIINVVAGGFALWSVLLASRPPDVVHPYGHGKIEFFSVGLEGTLIVLAAGGIFWEALPKIVTPRALPELDFGLIILLATALVNLWLGKTLIRTGERTRSMAVSADGKHILTDVYTTAGVLIGLFLVRQTGWYFLDGAVACVVAANILFMGAKLISESSSRLMHAYDPELLDQISEIIAQNRKPQWIDVHRLRAWRSGRQIYIDFHLILPREISLEDAHREVTEIEQLLKTQLPGVGDAMIHAEPCIGPECRICLREPCRIRGQAFFEQPSWCRKEVIYPGAADSENDSGPAKNESGRKFTRAGSD
ncbi:MAG: cation diffusion facilitator family transporter [Syntrophobacteraceae bacterium]